MQTEDTFLGTWSQYEILVLVYFEARHIINKTMILKASWSILYCTVIGMQIG